MRRGHAARDATARLRAVQALPEEPASVEPLLAAIEDVSLDVARAALRRLVPLAGPAEIEHLRGRLLELDIGIVGDAAATLRRVHDVGAATVCAAALESDPPARRHRAAVALRELRAPEARATLLHALEDETAPVRRTAIEALAVLPTEAASVGAMRRGLADPDDSVRAAAVRAVAQLDTHGAEALAALAADGARAVREALAGVACSLDRDTVAALLADEAAEVRVATLRAVAGCSGAAPLSCVLARAADESWHVRRAACDALAAGGGEKAARALFTLLLDSRLEVRGRALVALERRHGEHLEQELERALAAAGENPALRRSLIELLGARGRGAAALAYVADPVAEVRIAVAHALATEGSAASAAALRRLAGDADPAVRNAATTALERRQKSLRAVRR